MIGSVGAVEQSSQQALPVSGQLVVDPQVEAALIDQACVQGDLQVAADSALLALNDQAEVANAQLPGFAQQEQEGQAGRIAEDLSLARESGQLGGLGQRLAQRLSAALARVFEAQIGVTHA